MIKTKYQLITFAFVLSTLAASAVAQDTDAARRATAQAPPPKSATPATAPQRERLAGEARSTPSRPSASDPAAKAVEAVFNTLIDAIRRADAGAAMTVYWNSPNLLVFNYNGTATRTWDQVRANRISSYPKLENVKLDVRDVRVQTLGRDAALVTCLWSQSQTSDGRPESSTGRLSLVFRRVGAEWKIAHTHTSPDNPDPSRVMPSERTTTTTSTTTTSTTPAPTAPAPATTSPPVRP